MKKEKHFSKYGGKLISTALVFMLAVSAIAGCSSGATAETETAAQTQAEKETEAAAQTTAAAEEETEAEEVTTKLSGTDLLRDNFYEYCNEKLLDATEIPATSGTWSWFYQLGEDAFDVLNDELDKIIANAGSYEKGSDEQMISDLYLTYLDTETRDTAGFGPFEPYLEDITGASSVQEYVDALAALARDTSFMSLIYTMETTDSFDSTSYVEEIYGMDLVFSKSTLLDTSYDELMENDYVDYIALALTKAGYSDEDAASYAEEILDLTRQMAVYGLDTIDFYDNDIVWNVYSPEELCELFSNIDMAQYLKTAGIDDWDFYVVEQVEQCEKINELLVPENLELLKAYSVFCLVNSLGGYTSMDLDEADQELSDKFLGIAEEKELERRAAETVQSTFEFEFGKLYVDRCFSEEAKEDVTEMVETFIDHYRERIWELDWMEDETKEAAVKKLDTMVIKVGYPDEWPHYYEGAQLRSPEEGGSLIENTFELIKAYTKYSNDMVRKPVDRTKWDMSPQTVNAYYNSGNNEIVFPAAILQDPFYSADESKASNYGGIGTVIAHEITHAFDASGSNYDELGNYDPWWTEGDAERFEELKQEVIDYYDTIEMPAVGRYVNGEQTVNENIADLGAVNTVTSFFADDPEALDEIFRKYAAIWATKYSNEYLNYLLNIDTHSPAEARVNATIRTLDCFYETYPEIVEGDGMYLAPEDRVRIW